MFRSVSVGCEKYSFSYEGTRLNVVDSMEFLMKRHLLLYDICLRLWWFFFSLPDFPPIFPFLTKEGGVRVVVTLEFF